MIGRGPRLGAVVILGMLARAVLVPITHGPDFEVWDLASRATLGGTNVFAHHPAYSGGPYTYLPLFLYVEVPMQWLAQHTGIGFTVWGKLPIVGADLVTALLLARMIRDEGGNDGRQAMGAALFFLNPLVLYNGGFYGRFDSVAVALMLLAVRWLPVCRPASWRSTVVFALAIAAKTFPLFVIPWVLRRGRATALRVGGVVALVGIGLSMPYLVTSPGPFINDQLYSVGKVSGSLSWQVVLHQVLPVAVQVRFSQVLLVCFVLAVILVALLADDLVVVAATATLLFIVFSKVVIEQYLTWPLAFLVLLSVIRRSRPAAVLLVLLSFVGFVVNPYIHPFGTEPAVIDIVMAGAIVAGVIALVRESRATDHSTNWQRGRAAKE